MASAYTGVDSLAVYLTGAAREGQSQPDQAASLGGVRSGTEALPVTFAGLADNPIPNLRIDWLSGACFDGDNENEIQVIDGDTLAFLGADESTNDDTGQAIADGETKLLVDATDTAKAIRVTREDDVDLATWAAGSMTIRAAKQRENVIAQGNVTNAERAAGKVSYRGLMLRARAALTSVTIWNLNTNTEIATETADGAGEIQTIANETTAPTGPTFDNGTTEGTGIAVGSIADGTNLGLWIKRTVAAGADGSASTECGVVMKFTSGGSTYQTTLYGLFAIEETALAVYEAYVGVDAAPSIPIPSSAAASPDDTNATLPFAVTLTPGAGDTVQNLTVLLRNAYNLVSLNQYYRPFPIDSSGDPITVDPSGPHLINIEEATGGYIRVRANYSVATDGDDAADTWRIYAKVGADPTPGSDTPVATPAMAQSRVAFGSSRPLNTTIGPFAKGAVVHVIITTYRTSDAAESDNTTATQVTMTTKLPQRPVLGRGFFGDSHSPWSQEPEDSTDTTVYDAGSSTEAVMTPGQTSLFWNGTEILRIKYDSRIDIEETAGFIGARDSNNGIWTTFERITGGSLLSGASSGPVEFVDANTGYFAVNDIRRMLIDASASELHCVSIKHVGLDDCPSTNINLPFVELSGHTAWQVIDRATGALVTAAILDESGILRTALEWKRVNALGDIR